MKTFNQYVNEETMPFAQTDKGFVGIDDPAVRDNINSLLDGVTSKNFVTPYIGLERVAKVLANFHIFVPKYTFAGGDEGVTAFEINQFGPKIGMTDDGQVITNDSSPYYLYFEYRTDDDGMFGVFASVVTEDELDDLMSDYEDEEDEGEEMNEEKMSDVEMKKREEIVKSMKKNMSGFKERYGKDAKSVMYATATKQAMKAVEEENAPFEGAKKKSTPNPEGRARQLAKMAAKSAKKKAIKKVKEYGIETEREKGESGKEMYEASAEKLGKYLEKVNKLSRSELKARGKNPSVAVGKIIKKFSGNPKHAKVAATEETQIDEVSKKRLGAYIKQAADDKATAGIDYEKTKKSRHPVKKEVAADNLKRYQKRTKGISMAVKKLTKEENLDEVSKKTLASYIKKASHDVATKSAVTRGFARDADEQRKNKNIMGARKSSERAEKTFQKSWKRREGIAKAADKLAKEETQIDEISKEKLSRYVDKAPQSAANMSRKSVVGGSPEEKKKFYSKIDAKIDRRLDYVGKAIKKIKDTKD